MSVVWVMAGALKDGALCLGVYGASCSCGIVELHSVCVIAWAPVEGVVRAWALVSGLQRVDVALDGRSGAVRTF